MGKRIFILRDKINTIFIFVVLHGTYQKVVALDKVDKPF